MLDMSALEGRSIRDVTSFMVSGVWQDIDRESARWVDDNGMLFSCTISGARTLVVTGHVQAFYFDE